MKNITTKLLPIVVVLLLSISSVGFAQTVKYPSETQPGTANLIQDADNWIFSNDLFSASYILENGKLTFGGSDELHLQAGTEIFEIVLGNGTKVKASEMQWSNIHQEDLTGDANAVTYSEKLNGKALLATLKYNDLTFQWRALLRDGSHYLRTELEVSTTQDTPFKSITPMRYVAMNENGKPVPVKVGNTRGAVIASDEIFAAVETPLAINMTGGNSEEFDPFHWKPESWQDMTQDVPQAILDLDGYNDSEIKVAKGLVNVSEAGTWKFTFQYQSGSHRMNLVGVDLVDGNGTVVASDYHYGYTGTYASNRTYTLNIAQAGDYTLRYFAEVRTETITSSGNISITKAGTSTYDPSKWSPSDWKTPQTTVPSGVTALGFTENQIKTIEGEVEITGSGYADFSFIYVSGSHRMNLVGVDILDENNNVVTSDYHIGFTGNAANNNIYTLNIPQSGDYTLRYFAETKTESITSSGNISFTNAQVKPKNKSAEITVVENTVVEPTTDIVGKWSRNTTLKTTDTFKVSTVVGLLAEGQKRRSFLAYHERERAVPWRSFVLYNSWYELNIGHNNSPNWWERMTETQCLPVLNAWKQNLYDVYGVGIDAFVWDDGWDDFNSLWDFHQGFPNGFQNVDNLASQQGAGTGAWLGPVGGYGSSKNQRIAYWNSTHGTNISNFELSNKEYFDAFVGRCSQMVDDYDMRYFKFDGISTQFSSTGPSNEEDAEGILKVVNALREKRPDIFINTTVGTWASPFWFHYSDCVWRQENDYAEIGVGSHREKWITYRDRLVHQNFVENSPLCPINTLMTHGLIVTKNGPPAAMPYNNSQSTYKGIVKEMRCAFASGSGMVELYLDHDLMNNIQNKKLWKELSECITWHRANKEVLPDVHWVGGNPWDGAKANVYGWASWNEDKSTLALRNPSSTTKVFKTTLREALDIPAYVKGKIKLIDAFSNQTQYTGITNESLDIDDELTFNLPPFDVVVFNGVNDAVQNDVNTIQGIKSLGTVFGSKSKIVFKKMDTQSHFQIVDMKGAVLKSGKCKTPNFSVPMNYKGVYLVQINKREQQQVVKVICQ